MAAATALVKLLGDVSGFSKSLTEAQKRINRFGQTLTVAGARATASFTIPIVAAGVAILKFGSDFETAMAKVSKTIGPANADMKKLSDTMLDMAKTTTFSANELAEFTRIGAQLGVGGGDDINKNTGELIAFTQAISDLAIAANELPPEQAAKGIAKLIEVVGEDISKDVSRVTNTIALLGDTLPTSEEKVLNFAGQLAGMAKTLKLGSAELLGIAGGLSSVTNGVERAASAFQKFSIEFVSAIATGGPKLDEFARIISRTPESIKKAFAGGEADLLFVEFAEGLSRVSGEGENLFGTLKDLGFSNIKVMQTLLAAAGGADTLRKAMVNATENVQRLTKAQDEVKVIMATVGAQLQVLKAIFTEVFIKLFEAFKPQIDFAIKKLQEFGNKAIAVANMFKKLPDAIKFFIATVLGLVALIGPVFFGVGGLITTVVALAAAWKTATATLIAYKLAQKGLATTNISSGVAAASGSFGGAGTVGRNARGQFTSLKAGSAAAAATQIESKKASLAARAVAAATKGIGTAATTAFSTLKTLLGSAVFQFGAVVVAGLKLGNAIDKAGNAVTGGFSDHIEEAVSKVGFFRQSWEAAKISLLEISVGQFKKTLGAIGNVFTSIGETLATTLPTYEDFRFVLTSLFGEGIISGIESIGTAFANVLPGIAALIDESQELFTFLTKNLLLSFTDFDEQQMETQKQTIETAKKLGIETTAFNSLGAIAEEISKVLAKSSDRKKQVKRDADALTLSTRQLVLGMLQEKEATSEASKAAKFLGISVQTLTPEIQAVAESMMIAKESTDELNKSGIALIKTLEEEAKALGSVIFPANLSDSELFAPSVLTEEDIKIISAYEVELQKQEQATFDSARSSEAFDSILSDLNKEFVDQARVVEEAAEKQAFLAATGDRVSAAMTKMAKPLKALNTIFEAFGISADNIGRRVASSIVSITSGFKGIGSAIDIFRKSGKEKDGGGFLSGLMGGGIGDLVGNLASFMPAISAIAGPLFKLIGGLFKSKWEKIAEEGAKIFGKEFSEELAKKLEADTKIFDSLQNAIGANLGTVLEEVGVSSENLSQSMQAMFNALGMVENGTLSLEKAMDELGSKAFPLLLDQLHTMGFEGQVQIGKLITKMRELGVVSKEVEAFLVETSGKIIESFTPMLDLLNTQFSKDGIFGEGGSEAIAAVEANMGILTTTFFAAVQAAGGLGGAIALLPESFGELLIKFRELVGVENEALNSLTAYFNFAKENQEVLTAIDGVVQGIGLMAEMGLLNANNINSMTAAATLQMEQLLASTGNQTLALQAMGPQIGQLLEMYAQMGLEVPESLQAIADKALEAGANLVPPEGIEDILADIRDIMLQVAEAFGVAANSARDFTNAASGANAPKPRIPSGIPVTGARTGFEGTVTGPQGFFIEPGVTEDVSITEPGSGGGGINIQNVNLNIPEGITDPDQFALATVRALRDDPEVQAETQKVANA